MLRFTRALFALVLFGVLGAGTPAFAQVVYPCNSATPPPGPGTATAPLCLNNELEVYLAAGSSNIGTIGNTAFGITGALPTGANVIGGVTQSGTWNVGLSAGANDIGSVDQHGGPWTFNLTQVGGSALAFGQATMANSLPVTIASNQSSFTIAATQSGSWTIANTAFGITGAIPAGANDIGSIDQHGTWTVNQGGSWTVAATQSGSWTVTESLPYSGTADAQTATSSSALALVAFNGTTMDRLRVGPAGTAITGATAGVLYIQGIGSSGQVTVGGTVAATESGTWNVGLSAGANTIGSIGNTAFGISGSLPAGSNDIGSVDQHGTWTVTDALPYSLTADAQTATAASAAGLVAFNGTTVDRVRVGPAGTAISASTAGVLYVQGTGTSGQVPVSGTVAATESGSWTIANTAFGISAGAAVIGKVDQDGNWNVNQSTGAAGYGFILDSGGTNVAGVDSSHEVLTKVNAALPSGSNAIGGVTESGTWNVNTSIGTPSYNFTVDSAGTNVAGVNASHEQLVLEHNSGTMNTSLTTIATDVAPLLNLNFANSSTQLKVTSYGATGNAQVIDANGNAAVNSAQNNGGPVQPVACSKSAIINIASATTTQLVAISGSTVVYVCGFSMTVAGTSPTYTFVQGTGVNCATGQVSMSGAFAPNAAQVVYGSGFGTIFRTSTGKALCLTTAGTASPSWQGVLSYDQF